MHDDLGQSSPAPRAVVLWPRWVRPVLLLAIVLLFLIRVIGGMNMVQVGHLWQQEARMALAHTEGLWKVPNPTVFHTGIRPGGLPV